MSHGASESGTSFAVAEEQHVLVDVDLGRSRDSREHELAGLFGSVRAPLSVGRQPNVCHGRGQRLRSIHPRRGAGSPAGAVHEKAQ